VLRFNRFQDSRHHDVIGTQSVELSIKIEYTLSEPQTFHWCTWTQ